MTLQRPETEDRELVDRSVACCGNKHLILEKIVGLRRTRMKSNSISITGEDVVDRNLGVHLDNRQDWRRNTDAVC